MVDHACNDAALIVLAAGAARRMGGATKGLAITIDGVPLVVALLRAYSAGAGSNAAGAFVVTTAALAADYAHALQTYAIAARIVVNPQPELGPFSSLVAGIAALRTVAPNAAVFATPVDVPTVDATTWRALLLAYGANRAAVHAVTPRCNGHGGHPVLLSPQLAYTLQHIAPTAPDARLDQQLRLLSPSQRLFVEVRDSGIALNLNAPDDLDARRGLSSALT